MLASRGRRPRKVHKMVSRWVTQTLIEMSNFYLENIWIAWSRMNTSCWIWFFSIGYKQDMLFSCYRTSVCIISSISDIGLSQDNTNTHTHAHLIWTFDLMGTHGREDNLQSVGHKDHITQFSTTHKPQPLENPLGVESAPSSLDTNWTLWVSLRSKLLQGCFIGLQEKEQVMFCLWCGFHWPWSGCSFDHHNFRAYSMKQQRAAGESHTQGNRPFITDKNLFFFF